MSYETFLASIKNSIVSAWISQSWEEFERDESWQYLISCFFEHVQAIESITAIGYVPCDVSFREILSGDYPIIRGNDLSRFQESYYSGKSDLVPSIMFVNSQNQKIILDFWKAGLPF